MAKYLNYCSKQNDLMPELRDKIFKNPNVRRTGVWGRMKMEGLKLLGIGSTGRQLLIFFYFYNAQRREKNVIIQILRSSNKHSSN